ncbi:MAG TPA: hypothetical protein VHH94_05760 [Gammaproteobacteria bacterium]|nr:hypothetical protein [Gammaproteobacteria bacterium]
MAQSSTRCWIWDRPHYPGDNCFMIPSAFEPAQSKLHDSCGLL